MGYRYRPRDDIAERLEACIFVEQVAADIYGSFADLYPKAEKFWAEMARDEKRHATALIVGKGFGRTGKLPEEIAAPSLPLIHRTLDLAIRIRKKIRGGKVPPLEEAFRMALSLEESFAENYFNEIMNTERASSAVAVLKQMVAESKAHANKIRRYMKSAGLSA